MVSNELKPSYKFFFRSTPDDDINRACKKANKKSKNKGNGKKNEQTSS